MPASALDTTDTAVWGTDQVSAHMRLKWGWGEEDTDSKQIHVYKVIVNGVINNKY